MEIKKLVIINTTVLLGTIILMTGCGKKTIVDNHYSVNRTFNCVIENNEEKVINSKNNETDTSTLHNDDKNYINTVDDIKSEHTEDNTDGLDNQKFNDSDVIVLDVFDKINQEVDIVLQSEVNKEKAQGIFITIVDFIFYGAEIKGIKFNDLTEDTKQNILETAGLIDNKIENKFPNYKESISEKTKIASNKASQIIKQGANSVKYFSKEKLGEDNYNAIVESKDEVAYYTQNAFDIVGDITSNLWEYGKEKIKKWYENFKNN